MSYEDQANLAEDVPFGRRVSMCVADEAKGKDDYLAELSLKNPVHGAGAFMPFLATAPGFGDSFAEGGQEAIDDSMILAAVQANWAAVSALYPAEELEIIE